MNTEDAVAKIVPAKEGELRQRRYESAFVVDSDGNIVLEKNAEPHTPYELVFTDEEVAQMQNANGVVFTHNHPQGWKYDVSDPRHAGYSFSPEDVFLACKIEAVEIRAVSPTCLFSMKPPADGWNAGYWQVIEAVFQMEYAAANRLLTFEVLEGRMAPAQMQVELLHMTWIRVAGVLGLIYQSQKE